MIRLGGGGGGVKHGGRGEGVKFTPTKREKGQKK